VAAKLPLLALMGLTNAGWYSILKAQLDAAMPARSGAAHALNNLAGLASLSRSPSACLPNVSA